MKKQDILNLELERKHLEESLGVYVADLVSGRKKLVFGDTKQVAIIEAYQIECEAKEKYERAHAKRKADGVVKPGASLLEEAKP